MATSTRRLVELSMVPELAKEVAGALPSAAVADIASIGTADATDLPTAVALANATKARVNQLIAALKA
jgi:hypothetical protein